MFTFTATYGTSMVLENSFAKAIGKSPKKRRKRPMPLKSFRPGVNEL
jgi:hypothetical protein